MVLIKLLVVAILLIPSFVFADASDRIDSTAVTYQGAFLVPSGTSGGFKIAHKPGNGDGTLFIGDGRESYGGYIMEISIPTLGQGVISGLPRASVIQPANSTINSYLVDGANGKTQGQMVYDQDRDKVLVPSCDWYNTGDLDPATLSWVNTDSTSPAGIWKITSPENMVNKVGGYAFFAPQAWADAHTAGKSLIVGYHRGYANKSSNGPTMFATAPWEVGNPPAAGASIPAQTLLLYPSIDTAEGGTDSSPITNFTATYSMSDHAKGAVWIEYGGKRAVLFAGVKGDPTTYCYGSGCPAPTCNSRQGPNNAPYHARFWWYDVDDFEATAAGSMTAGTPSPYSTSEKTEVYSGVCGQNETDGVFEFFQSLAFDATTGKIYASEYTWNQSALSNETVIHVYQVDGTPPEPTLITCYPDTDSDTYGDINSSGTQRVTCLAGEVTNNTDCNDSNVAINPGSTEICGNGIDEDCSGGDQLCSGAIRAAVGSGTSRVGTGYMRVQ